jgi:hypothetical protein
MITPTDSEFGSPSKEERIVLLPVHSINLHCGTQIRTAYNEATIVRYAALMETEEGRAKFPPIVVYIDENGERWVADGHHRTMAAIRCQLTEIRAEIREGSKADALWAAAEINSKNGLPLESKDIRRTVLLLLETSPHQSLRAIADVVGCSKSYVGQIKQHVSTIGHMQDGPSFLTNKTIGRDGKLYPAARAKKSKDDAAGDSMIGNPNDTALPEPVVTVSLSSHATPTFTISNPSPESERLVCLTKRQRTLHDLYPNPVCSEELVEDILATFPDWYLCHLPFALFDAVIGNRKCKQDAEKLLVNFIGVTFLRSDLETKRRILRDIFERLFDNNETINEIMNTINAKREG